MRTYTIGRSPSNNIILEDTMVSRQHAQLIILDNGQVVIKDLRSSNGTYVNGNKISEYNLKSGDVVKCGSTFLNWSHYTINKGPIADPAGINKSQGESFNYENKQIEHENANAQSFSLGKILSYLTTKILETGDLFKTEWNRTQAILFFTLIPWGLTLLTLFILYIKFDFNFLYQVLFPFIVIILTFGVSHFIVISLLTVNRETNYIKNLFTSSIFSFIQYFNLLFLGLLGLGYYLFFGLSMGGVIVITTFILQMIIFPLIICMTISLLIFLYRYFQSIGISKSLSIHMVVFSLSLNLFFQFAFVYIFMITVFENKFPF